MPGGQTSLVSSGTIDNVIYWFFFFGLQTLPFLGPIML